MYVKFMYVDLLSRSIKSSNECAFKCELTVVVYEPKVRS